MSVTVLRVGCPYCKVGHASVSVVHRNGADQLEGVKDPHACDTCGRMMGLQVRMDVVGVPFGIQKPPRQGDVLRTLLKEG